MVSRRILVTQPNINGKTLGELHFSSMYGVNVTRVNRSGMDLFAARQLILQVGDRVMVVGPQDAIERVADCWYQLKRLDHPNIVTIFCRYSLRYSFRKFAYCHSGYADSGQIRSGWWSADYLYFDWTFRT